MLLNQRHLKLSVWLDWMNQWAELLDAGMPTVEALSLSTALLGQAHAEQRLKISLQQTQLALETGKPLAQAFEGASLTPPDCLRLALLCGASTGDLSKALRQQITQAQYLANAQNTLFKSLIYPSMVLIMSLVSWWLLQQFTQSNGAPPPSNTTPSDYLLGLGLISTLGLWMIHRRQRPAFAQAQGALGQRMGWLLPSGPQKVSGLFFVMACQVEAGIDLIQVLKHAGTPAPRTRQKRRNSPLDRELTRFTYTLLQSLAHGQPLHAAMHSAKAPAFMVTQARIAEQTGRLDTCFYLAAKVFDLQAKKRQAQLQAWLGPVTLLLAAGILIYAYQTTLAPLYANLGGF